MPIRLSVMKFVLRMVSEGGNIVLERFRFYIAMAIMEIVEKFGI